MTTGAFARSFAPQTRPSALLTEIYSSLSVSLSHTHTHIQITSLCKLFMYLYCFINLLPQLNLFLITKFVHIYINHEFPGAAIMSLPYSSKLLYVWKLMMAVMPQLSLLLFVFGILLLIEEHFKGCSSRFQLSNTVGLFVLNLFQVLL